MWIFAVLVAFQVQAQREGTTVALGTYDPSVDDSIGSLSVAAVPAKPMDIWTAKLNSDNRYVETPTQGRTAKRAPALAAKERVAAFLGMFYPTDFPTNAPTIPTAVPTSMPTAVPTLSEHDMLVYRIRLAHECERDNNASHAKM
jgi:hypothetical protein